MKRFKVMKFASFSNFSNKVIQMFRKNFISYSADLPSDCTQPVFAVPATNFGRQDFRKHKIDEKVARLTSN